MRSAEYTEITARNEVIDVLRGIGILLMVAGHMHFSALFNHYIFSFHMPLFLLFPAIVTVIQSILQNR